MRGVLIVSSEACNLTIYKHTSSFASSWCCNCCKWLWRLWTSWSLARVLSSRAALFSWNSLSFSSCSWIKLHGRRRREGKREWEREGRWREGREGRKEGGKRERKQNTGRNWPGESYQGGKDSVTMTRPCPLCFCENESISWNLHLKQVSPHKN